MPNPPHRYRPPQALRSPVVIGSRFNAGDVRESAKTFSLACNSPPCAKLPKVAYERDLEARGFLVCRASAKKVNIVHPGAEMIGPFCRLAVHGEVPAVPGVYAWTKAQEVMYIGKAAELRQIVHGARMQRAYNDYTYIPPSKALQRSSPRVRINALLNTAVCEGSTIAWWWLETESSGAAVVLEAALIREWEPPWNRARPASSGAG